MFVQSKATEDEDVDYVEEGTSNVFPDTAGDSLDNAEIIVQEKEFYLCYHYKNGKILIYHGKTSNPTDGKLEDLDPNGYLELVEKG